jgi:hypothetical protein
MIDINVVIFFITAFYDASRQPKFKTAEIIFVRQMTFPPKLFVLSFAECGFFFNFAPIFQEGINSHYVKSIWNHLCFWGLALMPGLPSQR